MTIWFFLFFFLPTCLETQGRCHGFQPTLNLLSVLCVSLEAHWILSVCTYRHPQTHYAPCHTHMQTHFLLTIQLTLDAQHQYQTCCLNNGTEFQRCMPLHCLKHDLNQFYKWKPWATAFPFSSFRV